MGKKVELSTNESFRAFWAIETAKHAIVDRMKELGGEEFSEDEYDTLRRLIYYFTTVGQRLLYVDWRWRTPSFDQPVFDDMLDILSSLQLGDKRSILIKWSKFYASHKEEEE